MNAVQLLTHFDRISEAPDPIPGLRQFILDLAVRGKLVQQDPKDEPASELLKRIQAEKARLVKEGKQRQSKPSLRLDETPFKIPNSWAWVRFGDIVRVCTGKLDANAAVEGGAYPFFTCSQTPSRIDTYSFDTSAVLLAGNGDFNIKRYQGRFDAYQRTYVIEPLAWDLSFCFILVTSQRNRITENHRGSAIPYLKLADITDPVVPFPPLAEQHRIVAKVNELMALCDRLEGARAERENRRDRLTAASLNRLNHPADSYASAFRDHAAFHLRHLPCLTARPYQVLQLRQTILNLAVRGQLVPQDPNDEPACELAKRARLARREAWEAGYAKKLRNRGKNLASDAWKSKYQLPKPATRQPRFVLPVGWGWVAWREVGTCQNGRAFPSTDYSESGIRLLRPGNLFADGSVVWNAGNTRFLAKQWAEEYPEFIVGEWEIVMNLTAQSLKDAFLGRACLTSAGERALLNQRIARLTSYSTWPRYTLLLFKSATFRDYVDGGLNQGALIQHMFTAQIDEFEFPLPPLAEQKRIVAKVEELLALCDQLEAQITTSQTERRRLLDAVLHQALVEPA